ncbi:MAG: glycosyltransferase family 4 protein [Burkholderiaceae bacterium]|nr:glycosyltransferase family 4 protein [Burkholderiaceae bacterium]
MKIGFVIGPAVSGDANGVKSQGRTWAEGLRALGHEVELVHSWGHYDWKSFDLIHVLGFGTWLDLVPAIIARSPAAIVLSPILDSTRHPWLQRCASRCAIAQLHMTSPLASLRAVDRHVMRYYARSEHERRYLVRALGIGSDRVCIVPLSCRFSHFAIEEPRQPFCLHVSILSSRNKNVLRLAHAAIRHGFRLVLAGSPGEERFRRELEELVREHPNIELHGFVDDAQLVRLYRTARVFALPSLFEGVGLVALEAAAHGADVVLTRVGAPKEYYDGMAVLVDPRDTDAIGAAVMQVLAGRSFQPALSAHVRRNFSRERIARLLESTYEELLACA